MIPALWLKTLYNYELWLSKLKTVNFTIITGLYIYIYIMIVTSGLPPENDNNIMNYNIYNQHF